MGKRKGRHIDGILIIDKPLGMSSNRALQVCKRLLQARKAGHTGALDPAASGVLPICLGEATKFSQYLLDADKIYQTDATFGLCTDTGDVEGDVTQRRDASALSSEDVEAVLSNFRGDISQIPPMYSALKRNGVPLYKLARQGEVVERKARNVTIKSLAMPAFSAGELPVARFNVTCTKGTYIRTLVEDIGEALDVGAHVSMLRRVQAGTFDQRGMLSLDELEAIVDENEGLPALLKALGAYLLPMDAGIKHFPECQVSAGNVDQLRLGQKIPAPKGVSNGLVRVKLEAAFIGLAECADEQLQPKRIVVQSLGE